MASDDAGPFSSTRARDAIARGELTAAEWVLTRPHSFSGVVEHGDKRGRTLGFPTANLGGICEMLPPNGVYAVAVSAMFGTSALYHRVDWKRPSSSLTQALSVSRQRRSRLVTTPSNGFEV